MERINSLNTNTLSFLEINLSNLSSYSFLLIVFVVLATLVVYLKRKMSSYLKKRNKLIEMSKDYERTRQCRNDLRVTKF